jgi:uncharacterized protein
VNPAAGRSRAPTRLTAASLRPVANADLEIRDNPGKGRGVFARAAISAGTLIEAAPVIIVPAAECPLLDRTILHDYYFRWDTEFDSEGSGAIALGITSLCNHSRRPRARVRCNHMRKTLDLVALTAIASGDEITIDYNCRLWFAAQD